MGVVFSVLTQMVTDRSVVRVSLVPSPSHPSFYLTAVEKSAFFSTAARMLVRACVAMLVGET